MKQLSTSSHHRYHHRYHLPDTWPALMVWMIFATGLYYALAKIGLIFVVQPENIASVWPPNGFFIGILLLTPRNQWRYTLLALFIANAGANLDNGNTWQVSLSFASANLLETLAAAWIIEYFIGGKIRFNKVRELIGFVILSAIVSNAATALIAAGILAVNFEAPFWNVWRIWWTADAAGMLFVTPFIVVWAYTYEQWFKELTVPRLIELTAILALSAFVAYITFSQPPGSPASIEVLAYLAFPLLLTVAIRFGTAGTTFFLLLLGAIAVHYTNLESGPFIVEAQGLTDRVIAVQLYLVTVALTSLTISIALHERSDTQSNLTSSEERYRVLFESAPVGISLSKPDGGIYMMNETLVEMIGYTREELEQADPNVIYDNSDDRDEVLQKLAMEGVVKDYELTMRHRDGTRFYGAMTIVPTTLGNQDVFVTMLMDITRRKQSEQALLEAKDAAEAANRSKSIFLSNMSHELRTPLNAILGFSQILAATPDLKNTHRTYVNTIHNSGEHLLEIINDILEISRIEAGRTQINPVDFDLFNMLQNLQEMLSVQAAEKALDFSIQYDSQKVPQFLNADSMKIQQILINLLRNAIKFTDKGSVTLRIEMDAAETRESTEQIRLIFTVQDTGIGMSEDELQSLFEPFWQSTKSLSFHKGTGLGLAIVQQFVDQLGGSIRVQSEVNQGTSFTFDVVAQIIEPLAAISPQQYTIIGVSPSKKPERILIVDDEAANRIILTTLITQMGFPVQECANGQEACEAWERWKPDLIWMDMRMPIMDGYEATQRIKALAEDKHPVKIIALTASAFINEKERIIAAGCDDYISKPFRHQAILELMHKHLGVAYIYRQDDLNQSNDESEAEAGSGKIGAGDLIRLPKPVFTALKDATLMADLQVIQDTLVQIEEHDAQLARTLKNWVSDYRFGSIMDLIDEAEKQIQ